MLNCIKLHEYFHVVREISQTEISVSLHGDVLMFYICAATAFGQSFFLFWSIFNSPILILWTVIILMMDPMSILRLSCLLLLGNISMCTETWMMMDSTKVNHILTFSNLWLVLIKWYLGCIFRNALAVNIHDSQACV